MVNEKESGINIPVPNAMKNSVPNK